MAITAIKHYVVDANQINIPNVGLGAFVQGFSEERKPFNWANIWFNLIPGGGQILFIGHVVRHLWVKKHPQRVLLYQNGFVSQHLDGKGNVKSEFVVNFNEIKGLLYHKTRQYQIIYGIRKYSRTDVELSILNSKGVNQSILTGSYRNENDIEGNYNFIGYACNAISEAWIQFAVNRFNSEMSARGYGSFTSPSGEVQVGKDFIKVGSDIVSSGFKYAFNNGFLLLYPNAAEGGHFKHQSKTISINISEMYNKEVFLMAIAQLHGIR